MDTQHDAGAMRFSLEILRSHPQIIYDHAVAAAECSGVSVLPRHVFFQAVQQLAIPRPEDNVENLATTPVVQESLLLQQLEQIRGEFVATATVREALTDIQRVVRAALGVEEA